LLLLGSLPLFGFLRAVLAHGAARGGAQQTVVARHVTRDASDDRSLGAAFCARGPRDAREGGAYGDSDELDFHVRSPVRRFASQFSGGGPVMLSAHAEDGRQPIQLSGRPGGDTLRRVASLVNRFRQVGLHRPRLLAAVAVGFIAFFLLPPGWTLTARVLVAWNIGVWPYLAAITWLMVRTSAEGVRGIAKQEDASSVGLMAIMCGAVVLSIAAIVVELARGTHSGESSLFVYGVTILTLLGSWLLVAALYTFHYAHLYYSAAAHRLPLEFPDGLKSPSYIDFMYFTLTICVAVQTSDVSVRSSAMRATVMIQSVLCFFFNLAVLGLSINIAAGFAGGRG
jgi:uncharacterized membrane protein